jgi:hypothetical protein
MAKTVDQMVTIVADALGKSENASALSGALLGDRCIDFLNWAQQRVARFYSFHELNTYTESAATVASTSRYPLVTGTNNLGLTRPKDIQSVRLIDGANSRILRRRSPRWFDQKFPLVTTYSDGRPSLYIRWGNNLELFRRPDAVYTLYIRYPQWAPDLVSGGSDTVFENKDQLLICGGILEGYLHFAEYEQATQWLQKFLGLLVDGVRAEGDIDWEPQAQAMSTEPGGYSSGEPWLDPYATTLDPLYGYDE